ncbi:hypothetical protein JCM19376_12280 [Fusibacter bizertensis]
MPIGTIVKLSNNTISVIGKTERVTSFNLCVITFKYFTSFQNFNCKILESEWLLEIVSVGIGHNAKAD